MDGGFLISESFVVLVWGFFLASLLLDIALPLSCLKMSEVVFYKET